MTPPSPGRAYTLRLAAAALAVLPVFFVLSAAWQAYLYTHALLYSGCHGERTSLERFGYESEAVSFPSRRGPELRGWYSPGSVHPEVAIIVLTGHGGNTCFALPDAAMLARAGYGTLVYEHRACADYTLAASTGPHEAHDLLGAVDYLASRPGVEHIGVLGFSEGGTASLLAAAEEPRIEAVVAMGGYASLTDDILEPGVKLGWYNRLVRRFVLWFLPLDGVAPSEARPVDVVGRISPRPLLLIYGEHEAEPGRTLLAAAGSPAELWIVPQARHGEYAFRAPDEYEQRIVDFFNAAFGAAQP